MDRLEGSDPNAQGGLIIKKKKEDDGGVKFIMTEFRVTSRNLAHKEVWGFNARPFARGVVSIARYNETL